MTILSVQKVTAFLFLLCTTAAFQSLPQRRTLPNSIVGSLAGRFAATEGTSETAVSPTPWTVEELEDYCDRLGVVVSFTTFGPGYRAVARAKYDETLILGYVEGFLRPAGAILHLDKMEVFQPMLQRVRRKEPQSFDFGGISFGLGLVMGYRCLLFAKEKGCSIAEFLAIDDEEFQHKRLVRYYKRVGFQTVKYVGEDIGDIPDRLVWGGCGTLMKEDIDILIQKWAALLLLMEKRGQETKDKASKK